jgi:hypothetical protein
MLKIEFSEADVKALRYECYHHPHPRVQLSPCMICRKSTTLPGNTNPIRGVIDFQEMAKLEL